MGGSSRQAIAKYILANFKVEPSKVTVPLRLALRNGLEKGTLKNARVSGKGSGSYRVAPVVKDEKAVKPKKPAAKTGDTVAGKAKKLAGKYQKDTAVSKSSAKEVKGKKITSKKVAKSAKKLVAPVKKAAAKKSLKVDGTSGNTVSKTAPGKKTAAKKSGAKVSADKKPGAKKAPAKKAA